MELCFIKKQAEELQLCHVLCIFFYRSIRIYATLSLYSTWLDWPKTKDELQLFYRLLPDCFTKYGRNHQGQKDVVLIKVRIEWQERIWNIISRSLFFKSKIEWSQTARWRWYNVLFECLHPTIGDTLFWSVLVAC